MCACVCPYDMCVFAKGELRRETRGCAQVRPGAASCIAALASAVADEVAAAFVQVRCGGEAGGCSSCSSCCATATAPVPAMRQRGARPGGARDGARGEPWGGARVRQRAACFASAKAFAALSVKRRPKWVGVNLGGWLLLERGPSAPLFQEARVSGDEEWGFCEQLRRRGSDGNGGGVEEVLRRHRATHVTEQTIMDVKAMGLNAVRELMNRPIARLPNVNQ